MVRSRQGDSSPKACSQLWDWASLRELFNHTWWLVWGTVITSHCFELKLYDLLGCGQNANFTLQKLCRVHVLMCTFWKYEWIIKWMLQAYTSTSATKNKKGWKHQATPPWPLLSLLSQHRPRPRWHLSNISLAQAIGIFRACSETAKEAQG